MLTFSYRYWWMFRNPWLSCKCNMHEHRWRTHLYLQLWILWHWTTMHRFRSYFCTKIMLSVFLRLQLYKSQAINIKHKLITQLTSKSLFSFSFKWPEEFLNQEHSVYSNEALMKLSFVSFVSWKINHSYVSSISVGWIFSSQT